MRRSIRNLIAPTLVVAGSMGAPVIAQAVGPTPPAVGPRARRPRGSAPPRRGLPPALPADDPAARGRPGA